MQQRPTTGFRLHRLGCAINENRSTIPSKANHRFSVFIRMCAALARRQLISAAMQNQNEQSNAQRNAQPLQLSPCIGAEWMPITEHTTHTHTIYSFKANKSSVVFVLSQTNFNILTVERTEVAAKHLFFDESTTLFNVLLLTYSQSNAFAFDTAPRLIWQIQTNSSFGIRSIYAMKKSQRWILPEESGSCRECCWFRFEFNEKSSSTEGILFNAL